MELDFTLQSLAPDAFRVEQLDSLSDQALDAAPFGVICLDGEGTVLRYNLYEARLARLDANQVIGRDFFTEIARCTRGPGFEGHFRSIVGGSSADADRYFDYVFDFKFGAQVVGVEIVSFREVERFYLLINRSRVDLPRDAATEVGTLQRQLAPDESSLGVRRDELERRYVNVPAAFFMALRATFTKVAPEAWPVFAHEWGVQWGRRAAIDLEGIALEQKNQSLANLPMSQVVSLTEQYFETGGWGKVSLNFQAIRVGFFEARLERSALAEAIPRTLRSASTQASCALLGGALAGVFGHVASKRLVARECACMSSGAPHCHFVLVAVERSQELDDALVAHGNDVESIQRSLRGRRK
jgi:photoactive yellow protein